MDKEQWAAVDRYLCEKLIPPDAALDEALRASAAAGLPAINVSATQGKFLQIVARMLGALRILEVGTLGGYSTIWLARALPPGGRLVTLEADAKHARVARANIAAADLDRVVELRLGLASESLAALIAERAEPFDLIFIDADKENIPDYFRESLSLARPGAAIVVDNVVRNGEIVRGDSPDPSIQGVRRFNELVAAEPRVTATALQTVGAKGYDGFALLLVNDSPSEEKH